MTSSVDFTTGSGVLRGGAHAALQPGRGVPRSCRAELAAHVVPARLSQHLFAATRQVPREERHKQSSALHGVCGRTWSIRCAVGVMTRSILTLSPLEATGGLAGAVVEDQGVPHKVGNVIAETRFEHRGNRAGHWARVSKQQADRLQVCGLANGSHRDHKTPVKCAGRGARVTGA